MNLFFKRRNHEIFARRWCFFLAAFYLLLFICWRVEVDKIFEPVVKPVWSETKTEAKTTPVPTPALRQEIEEFGRYLFGKDWTLFKKIIACESGFKPEADNGHDVGLSQINQVHGIPERWLKDWRVNLSVAYKLWREQGWNPWKPSSKCWSKL